MGLLHQASIDAGTMHLLEKETREKEQRMVDAWRQAQAASFLRKQQAKHPFLHMDVFMLDTKNSVWVSKVRTHSCLYVVAVVAICNVCLDLLRQESHGQDAFRVISTQ
jgi:hypothetical protein